MRHWLKINALTLSLFLACCAQKELTLKSKEIEPLKALEENFKMTKVQGHLNVLNFTDDRSDKKTIGIAKTGLFNTPTPMYLDTPVNEYMKSVFTNSLGKRGIEVAAPAKYSIRGSIKELWISEDNGFIAEFSKCDMKIEFTIVSSKTLQPVYEGTANSQIYGTNYSIETTDSNGPALKSCIDGFAEQLIQNSGVQKILNLKVL